MSGDSGELGAHAARSLYVFHRNYLKSFRSGATARDGSRIVPAWDGGVDRNGRRNRPVWPRIVTAAAASGVGLVTFMEAQFAPDRPTPEPNMLVGEKAVERAAAYVVAGPKEAAAILEVSLRQVGAEAPRLARIYGLDIEDAARAALRDPGLGAPAIFRYCFAASAGAVDMLPEFRDGAVAALAVGYHAYTAGWGDFLNVDLLEAAVDILAALCGDEGGGS